MSRASPSPMESLRNELLTEVAARAADTARDLGLSEDLADQVGAAIADALAEDWGGQVISVPKDYAYRLAERDRAILNAHREGASLAELAKDYHMTVRGLRKLIRRAELRDPHWRQTRLFDV